MVSSTQRLNLDNRYKSGPDIDQRELQSFKIVLRLEYIRGVDVIHAHSECADTVVAATTMSVLPWCTLQKLSKGGGNRGANGQYSLDVSRAT